MRKTECECVDCGKPCLRNACPYYEVTRFYCDECGEEETLYHYDGEELCMNCIEERLKKVEGSE